MPTSQVPVPEYDNDHLVVSRVERIEALAINLMAEVEKLQIEFPLSVPPVSKWDAKYDCLYAQRKYTPAQGRMMSALANVQTQIHWLKYLSIDARQIAEAADKRIYVKCNICRKADKPSDSTQCAECRTIQYEDQVG